jgi:hypothetical protein
MAELSKDEKMTLIQYAIKKYENEEVLIEKLKRVLSEKDIQRGIDTLIGTQGELDLKSWKTTKAILNYQKI